MRKAFQFFRLIPVLALVAVGGCWFEKPFSELTSLKITYKTVNDISVNKSSMEMTGERVVILDLKNNRMREETSTLSATGMTETSSKNVRFFDGQRMYQLSPIKPNEATYFDYPHIARRPVWETIGMPGETRLSVNEKIAGVLCEVFEYQNSDKNTSYTKTWVWNRIEMKKIQKSNRSTMTFEAVKIERDVKLSDDLFKLPEGCVAVSQQEALKKLKESIDDFKKKSSK